MIEKFATLKREDGFELAIMEGLDDAADKDVEILARALVSIETMYGRKIGTA